ncbi:Gfo/Idh/MocA family oxidoreductase [Tessaracoccus sp.]
MSDLRLAILGSSVGNGHPYSWGAIFNGYDRDLMTDECPFPGIPGYLNLERQGTGQIPGARVTHVHCVGDGGFSADHVARCALIPQVVQRAEDVIGEVDAVLVATDRGSEHVERCRPFVEAGIPVFVDKPLATNEADLATFKGWVAAGAPIMSSSSMRYSKEFQPYRTSTRDLGDLRYVSITSPKSWEAYGIHALEAVYPIVGPGFISVRNTGTPDANIVHLKHQDHIDVVAAVNSGMYGGFGYLQLSGTNDTVQLRSRDSYHAFRSQLNAFVDYVRTGVRPFPFEETVELIKLVIAGLRSRDEGGREVFLEEIDG